MCSACRVLPLLLLAQGISRHHHGAVPALAAVVAGVRHLLRLYPRRGPLRVTSPPRMTRDGSLRGGGMLAADGGVDHVPRPGIAQPCPRATIPMVALSRGVLSQAMPARGTTPWGGMTLPTAQKGGGVDLRLRNLPGKAMDQGGSGEGGR